MSIDERLRRAGLPPLVRPVWLEIDVAALADNLAAIRARVGPAVGVWPAVKADGYGHGLEVVARTFLTAGADGVCVATLDEAMALRAAGIDGPVLVLYPVPATAAEAAARQGFQLTIATAADATALAEHWSASGAARRGARLRLHVEVETGLSRMGVRVEEAAAVVQRLAIPGLEVVATWSHLASPTDTDASAGQEARLEQAVAAARAVDPGLGASHLAASGGLLTGRGLGAQLVRPGLAAYGVPPDPDLSLLAGMRPAMRLKAHAMRVLDITAGTAVGYGGTWIAPRPSVIATLPVGYGDGYPRALTGAPVLVRGRRARVVGTVAMDALMVDVTDVGPLGPDEEFVLLGPQGDDAITASELARWRTTIPWEVVTGMTRRLARVYDAEVGLLGVRTLAGETLVPDMPLS